MDKKSGVYYELKDNSLRVGGSSYFGGIVLMYTSKGEVGKLNKVTIRDYKEKLGYDLRFNPNYEGLDRMLSSVSSLEVLRLNNNPTVAYKYWDASGVSVPISSPSIHENAFSAIDATPADYVYLVCKSPGTWCNNSFVVFSASNVPDEYILTHFSSLNGVPKTINTFFFSVSENAYNYYKNVDFGDFEFGINGDFFPDDIVVDISSGLPVSDSHKFVAGSNGSVLSDYTTVKDLFSAIDNSQANVVVLNGLIETHKEDTPIIKAIIEYCGKQDRSVLIDAPLWKDPTTGFLSAGGVVGEELFKWSQSLYSVDYGHYAQVVAVPDQVTIGGLDILVQPSVFLFQVYARMYNDFGSINYPPAGHTYGVISVYNLMENDYHLYGDELKTNRINYAVSSSLGTCLWEYRTLHPLTNSDLSYSNTPYILRDLKGRLMSFMEQFSFRYSTPIDLLTMRSGLASILDGFVRSYFIVNYTLSVPSYEEAQAAGRELYIDIEVSVINSADVITLRVNLRNAADLRAA